MAQDMTSGSPSRHIITFMIPVLLGNMLMQAYNLVDSIIVGRYVGVHALAAIGAVTYMDWLMLGFGGAMVQGFAILTAQRFGSHDYQGMRTAISMSFILTAAICAVLTVGGLLAVGPLLRLLNTPVEIIADSQQYISIIYSFMGVFLFTNLFNAHLRAIGDSRSPFVALIIASLINVGLDFLFVVGFGWGVAGAAYASVIAFTCPWPFLIWRIRRTEVMRLHRKDWKLEWHTLSRLIRLGLPLAIQNSVISVGTIILQAAVNGYGALHVAGFTSSTKIFFFFKEPAVAINFAMATYTAQNYGAGDLVRVQKGLRRGVVIAMCVCAVAMLTLFMFGPALTGLLVTRSETEVITVATDFLRMLTIMLPALYLLMTYRPVLVGLGNTFIPMVSGIVELAARVLLVIILPPLLGFCSIAIAEVSAWFTAGLLVIAAYYATIIRLRRRCKPVDIPAPIPSAKSSQMYVS